MTLPSRHAAFDRIRIRVYEVDPQGNTRDLPPAVEPEPKLGGCGVIGCFCLERHVRQAG